MNKFLITLGALTVAFAAWVVLSDVPTQPAFENANDVADEAGNRVGRWGSAQRAGAVADQMHGKLQEFGAKLTGDDELGDRAKAKQAGAALRDAAGEVAQAAGQTIKDLNV